MIELKKMLIAVVLLVVVSCAFAQEAPPPPAQTSSGPVVLAQAPPKPAQMKTGNSQAELDAAVAAAKEANARADAATNIANAANKRANALDQQLFELKKQYQQERARATLAGVNSPRYRSGMRRAEKIARKISSLQSRISRETSGPASKWAQQAVGDSLESGNIAGMVGDKPNTNLNSKFWRKKVDNQQLAVTMERLRGYADNTAKNEAKAAVTVHNQDVNAHEPIQKAIAGESTARENADRKVWPWIYGLVAGVVIAIIVALIAFSRARQRREVVEREYADDEPLQRPEPQRRQPRPEDQFYQDEDIDLGEPEERAEVPTILPPPPPPAPAPVVIDEPAQVRRPVWQRGQNQ